MPAQYHHAVMRIVHCLRALFHPIEAPGKPHAIKQGYQTDLFPGNPRLILCLSYVMIPAWTAAFWTIMQRRDFKPRIMQRNDDLGDWTALACYLQRGKLFTSPS